MSVLARRLQNLPATPGPPGPGGDPSDVAGLTLWLDASSLSGFADGDPIDTWPDLSGNNNNASSSGGARPLYRPTGVGGQPALDFPNSDYWMQLAFSEAASNWTWFFVLDADNPSHSGLSYLMDVQTGRLIIATREDTGEVAYFDGSWRRSGAAPTTGEQVYEYNLAASSSGAIYRNKTALATGMTYTQRALGGTTRLGSAYNTNTNYFLGRMAEVIAYNSALGTGDRDVIYDYLAGKYGFSF